MREIAKKEAAFKIKIIENESEQNASASVQAQIKKQEVDYGLFYRFAREALYTGRDDELGSDQKFIDSVVELIVEKNKNLAYDFKALTDTYGSILGEELLQEVFDQARAKLGIEGQEKKEKEMPDRKLSGVPSTSGMFTPATSRKQPSTEKKAKRKSLSVVSGKQLLSGKKDDRKALSQSSEFSLPRITKRGFFDEKENKQEKEKEKEKEASRTPSPTKHNDTG